MTRAFVSPMGDPTFANAATSIASALFPNSRMQAAGQMAGAQYAGQQLNNRQTELENVGLDRSNAAFASLGDVIADPRIVAILQAGGGNADQLAGALGEFQSQGFRQGARDKAVAGNYGGAVAEQFGLANGPVRINDIDSGYQLNPYQQGGPINATGETLADIALSAARIGQANASANASNQRAAKTADEMANPGKYRAPGGGAVSDVSPSEAKALDDLIGMSLPGAIPDVDGGTLAPQIDTGVRNDILLRATQLYQQNQNAGVSVAQAVSELADIKAGVPGEDGLLWDDEGTAPVVSRKAGAPALVPSAPAPAATPAPAPAATTPAAAAQAAPAAAQSSAKARAQAVVASLPQPKTQADRERYMNWLNEEMARPDADHEALKEAAIMLGFTFSEE